MAVHQILAQSKVPVTTSDMIMITANFTAQSLKNGGKPQYQINILSMRYWGLSKRAQVKRARARSPHENKSINVKFADDDNPELRW